MAAKTRLVLGLLSAALTIQPAFAADGPVPLPKAEAHKSKGADFAKSRPSQEARQVADWAIDSGDSGGLPFAIIDKANASIFVFNAQGSLHGASAVLLGLAHGDDSVPGIGQRKLSNILPQERTTPAGRFVATLDHNLQGKEILWVDYETSISLHPVITSNARERRAERLASPSPLDNRISYGCINVPVSFYANVVSPAFTGTDGIVYVLPETRSAQFTFDPHNIKPSTWPNATSQVVLAK